ncbi:MAG: transposase [Saccharofermentanales bacterium]|jgi:hypothetical protein
MFRANDKHNQETMLDSRQWMNSRVVKKLEKSWAPIFYENVFRKVDEEPFAVLYGTTGRPNFPVNILLSLEYIKHMKNCTDIEILDSFYFDYQINYAVGIRSLGELNLAERTLNYFRERIYQYSIENPESCDLLFEQFINLLHIFTENTGVSLEEQRTDTTLFMSNIKKSGRMSLAYDVLVQAVNAIPEEKRTDALTKVLEPNFKTDILYRTRQQDGDSKLTQLLSLCEKALHILEAQPDMLDSEEVQITRRFLTEQSISDEQSAKLVPKPNKEISPNSLQSAYDTDATFRRKGTVSQSGYVLEISETCSKDNDVQFITDYAVESNTVSDVEILTGRMEEIRRNTNCTDMYVDGGFHSKDVYDAAKDAGMEIHLTNMSGTEPRKNLPVTAFEIDPETNIIIKCPKSYTPTQAGVSNSQTTAHFPHESCAGCEFRVQCYSTKQKKDCVVRISLNSIKVSQQREAMKADRKENTSMRAGIEGTNSALKRKGQDKLKVRGKVKSTMISALKVTGQNISRFIKYMQGGYKPKAKNMPQQGITAHNFN